MSDGPHRSLPLKRHWKRFAQKAANGAYSIEEVQEELERALSKELKDARLDLLERIFLEEEQGQLFEDEKLERANRLLESVEGSTVFLTAAESAIETIMENKHGEEAIKHVLRSVADEIFQKHARSIEEHWQREAGYRGIRTIRNRLNWLRSNFSYRKTSQPRSDASSTINRRNRNVSRTGLDEGPAL
ncbi:hypothetical protein [Thalassospira australica]|uniref:hypothetical protein n=1 Tax=Thalassospira australica TaxID=1528106 RepID=UPI00384B2731